MGACPENPRQVDVPTAIQSPMNSFSTPDYSAVSVRLAVSEDDIHAAQRVRYQVFYEENGAHPSAEVQAEKRDFDDYDAFADHLIVVDNRSGSEHIVGTYRLLPEAAARKAGGFYSTQEFDLDVLQRSGLSLLELGRSCVLPDFRARPVLRMLWQGIADYITERKIDMMFGCASLRGVDVEALKAPLSYMYHYHLAALDLCPRAVEGRFVDMNIVPKDDLDARRIFAGLPPIIKGYLRLGGYVGNGAVVDEQFNTTDVLVMVETQSLTKRYRDHYERKLKKTMHGAAADQA